MIRFHLHRSADATGVSGSGIVAEGVRFANGKCALSWLTKHASVALYDDIETVVAIHGHGGQTKVVLDEQPFAAGACPFLRAVADAHQDSMENAPFACVGGVVARTSMKVPKWIDEADAAEWLAGYRFAVIDMYGADWQTCAFGWAPALTIGADQAPAAPVKP